MGYLGPCKGLGSGSSGGQTSGNLTLYARSTGNANNDGLTIATAVRQPEQALAKVPKNIIENHQVLIDCKEETSFQGFSVDDFDIAIDADLLVEGLYEQPTLTTGSASGTADGGFFSSLTDSSKRGRLMNLLG